MNDLFLNLLGYVLGAWRYRWHALLVTWVLCLTGWGWLYFQHDQYRANAQVYVDTESILRPLLKGMVVSTDVREKINIVTKILLSRPNLKTVLRETDLDLRANNKKQYEKLMKQLHRRLSIVSGRKRNLYSISYRDVNPDMAKLVVQTLLTGFVENALGANRQDTSAAQRFLDQQIEEYEKQLVAAEERLKQFKQKNVGMMPTEGRGYYNRLQVAMEVYDKVQLQLAESRHRRNELKRQLSGETPSFGMFTPLSASQTASSVDSRIQKQEENLDAMLLRYTDQHPDIITLRQSIEDLRAQKQHELEDMAGSGRLNHLDTNPVYQKLKISLGEAEADIAVLEERARNYKARLVKLEEMVDTVPKVEAELAKLNRDYNVIRQQYDNLLLRRESAKMSEQAEQSSDDIKFKIISPPYVQPEPISPNRPLFMSVILIASLVAGIGYGLFLYQFNPTFFERRSMTQELGLPVLGTISFNPTPAIMKRRKLATGIFLVSVSSLFVLYAGLMVMHKMKIDPLGLHVVSNQEVHGEYDQRRS